jgi:HlyD family secretion protein
VTNRVEEAMTQLRDLKPAEADLRERRLDLIETIEQLDVRAPRDGVVLDMRIFALRAVVQAADPILYVVPISDELVVETRIRPQDIDQVWPGQPARLRFAAFNQRTTPEVAATVLRISPDALQDQATGETYYSAEITLAPEALDLLDGLTLIAGMPVDAFIQTGARSPLAYLVQPMTDFLARAWREQ